MKTRHLVRFLLAILASCDIGVARADSPANADATRQAFHKIIDRPAVDLNPQLKPMPDVDGLSETHLIFTAEPGQPVPAIIVQPKTMATHPRPVVIVLHGTGGTKEGNIDLLKKLASRGFIAIAPDGRYHGERSAAGKGTVDYFAAIVQAYKDGKSHPWLYDTVYDVTRLMDYLQTRSDVDAQRIGLIGFSKGGMETYLTAAIDQRVAVAVPCISVQSFAYELDHDAWHGRIGTVKGAFDSVAKLDDVASPDRAFVKKFYDRIIPGIDGQFDCPAMLPLISPRPLLTINGEDDPINPLASAQLAIEAAQAAYAAAGAADHFHAEIEPKTPHSVTPEYKDKAVEWFVQWLKPEAN